MSALPAIEPMPSVADCVLPWDGTVHDTLAAIVGARTECSDTFAVDSGRGQLMSTFSVVGGWGSPMAETYLIASGNG